MRERTVRRIPIVMITAEVLVRAADSVAAYLFSRRKAMVETITSTSYGSRMISMASVGQRRPWNHGSSQSGPRRFRPSVIIPS
jgi:hypothetical protein